jgi:hypothetical protein
MRLPGDRRASNSITPVPTENSIRVEARNLVSRGGQAFAADPQAKFMASTWTLWRNPGNP